MRGIVGEWFSGLVGALERNGDSMGGAMSLVLGMAIMMAGIGLFAWYKHTVSLFDDPMDRFNHFGLGLGSIGGGLSALYAITSFMPLATLSCVGMACISTNMIEDIAAQRWLFVAICVGCVGLVPISWAKLRSSDATRMGVE